MELTIVVKIFSFEIDQKIVTEKRSIIDGLVQEINNYIKNKDYGSSIEDYDILLYVVNPKFTNKHLFRHFKPKYTDYKLITSRYTGEKIEIKNNFNYSINIDGELYTQFITATELDSKKIFCGEFIKSLSYLDKLPKKVTDFKADQFRSDIYLFFREQKLIE